MYPIPSLFSSLPSIITKPSSRIASSLSYNYSHVWESGCYPVTYIHSHLTHIFCTKPLLNPFTTKQTGWVVNHFSSLVYTASWFVHSYSGYRNPLHGLLWPVQSQEQYQATLWSSIAPLRILRTRRTKLRRIRSPAWLIMLLLFLVPLLGMFDFFKILFLGELKII